MLAGFGLTDGQALSAVLAYRAVNFWLPIPFGGLAYASLEFEHRSVRIRGAAPARSSSRPGHRQILSYRRSPGAGRRAGATSRRRTAAVGDGGPAPATDGPGRRRRAPTPSHPVGAWCHRRRRRPDGGTARSASLGGAAGPPAPAARQLVLQAEARTVRARGRRRPGPPGGSSVHELASSRRASSRIRHQALLDRRVDHRDDHLHPTVEVPLHQVG